MEGKLRRREINGEWGEEEWELAHKMHKTRKRKELHLVGWDLTISHIEPAMISLNLHIMSTLVVNT